MRSTNLTRRSTPVPSAVRNDPFLQFVDRFFGDSSPILETWRREANGTGWIPPVDIRETENAFICTADLPGLTKDDIEVTVEDGVLSISGERSLENVDNENSQMRRIERSYGSFRRSFTLPTGVDAGKVEAKFQDGVLNLTLPKAEAAKPRKIEVKPRK